MRALTVAPKHEGSLALTEVEEPIPQAGCILARTLAIGICGTDHEIVRGEYGEAPAESTRLIIGHESIAEIISTPADCGLAVGDMIAGIVRRPDPVPCPSCAVGEWDMCRNGLYTERGIKGAHGYASEFFTIDAVYAVKIDGRLSTTGVLLEPASIVAKAWDHIERIGARARWLPKSVLVTGAGTVGLLAAMMGVQRGLEVCLFDRNQAGIKPALAAKLGAHFCTGELANLHVRPDIIIECTGASSLIVAALEMTGPGGIVCLAGLSSGRRSVAINAEILSKTMVLENDVLFGTVNANRRHYAMAAEALAAADRDWLDMLITRRLPLRSWAEAFTRVSDDVKTIIDFTLP